ncbi:hypothetical protein PN36_09485 [Candidatus Thiomargarita nelsonii]|uniref:Nucleoprotein/polynucleotide-associated enzyme n=1 Tax=Candidatus Thiomargarita nelsonii TaxID=1003181 RepID=A0A4E0QRJ5_9GAMM|nr:hypothetical protein PN36_09485 [Candidatus Thiomargarita nelsonii]
MSLRDQLLKTGLVSKTDAKQVEKQAKSKYHQQQKRKKKKRGKTESVDTESAAYVAAKAREEEIAQAKKLNQQKEAERLQKALLAQISDLIQRHQVNDLKADIAYHFLEGKIVKKIFVNAKQQNQLSNGDLAITVLDDSHYIVPVPIAEKILARLPQVVVYLNQNEEKASDVDEQIYADYPVPDDLMW